MSFLNRRGDRRAHAADVPRFGAPVNRAVSEIDWANIDNVRAEWQSAESGDEGGRVPWSNGMRLADQDIPGQRFNAAEYMARGLHHHLFGPGPLSEAEAILTIQRMLSLLERAPDTGVVRDKLIPKYVRLPLAITKIHRWQPPILGGTGPGHVLVDTPLSRAAVACVQAPPGQELEHFFRG